MGFSSTKNENSVITIEMKTMKTLILNELSIAELKEIVAEAVKTEFAQCNILVPKENNLLIREEVAEFLKISLPTLNSWTKSGKLIAYRIGARVYFKRQEIMEKSLTKIKWTTKTR